MAIPVNERVAQHRARAKMKESERLKVLLAKRIKLDLYHATNDQLEIIMQDTGCEEAQDVITRLIAGYSHLTAEQKKTIFK
jgi:hypothetical protein